MTRNKPTAISLTAIVAALAGFSAPPAHAFAPLPAATVQAQVAVCTTDPCQNGFSQTSATGYYVATPLSQFGKAYTVSVSAPGGNPAAYTYAKTTPGVMSLGAYGSPNYAYVAIDGSPRVTAAASNTAHVGGTITYGALSYNFRVVNDANPNLQAPVVIDLSAAGSLYGSATSPPYNGATLNSASVTSEMTVNFLYDEKAAASFNYECVFSTGACQAVNNSTSNVTITYGSPTSTYNGGFTLANKPLTIDTGLIYGITLSTTLSIGGAPGSAFATVDPSFTLPEGYSLELSPGISNGAVPEPSAWALMTLGVAALGAVRRRRRAKPQLGRAMAAASAR